MPQAQPVPTPKSGTAEIQTESLFKADTERKYEDLRENYPPLEIGVTTANFIKNKAPTVSCFSPFFELFFPSSYFF